jgi:SAM-dependent methyltransferase
MPRITSPPSPVGRQSRRTPWPSERAAATRFNPAEFANIARHERSFWWYRGMRDIQFALLDPFLNNRSFHNALEAGCGTGFFALELQQERGLPLAAMDYSFQGLRFGVAAGLTGASQGSLLELPFGAGAFDLALCLDVLQQFHPGEERRALFELARVLQPGGLLSLRVSAFRALRSRHSEFVCERQRYTRPQLNRLAQEAGFRTLRAVYANTLLSPIALLKFRVIEPLFSPDAESGIQDMPRWLNGALYGMLAAEAAWLRAGLSLPFGQSLLWVGEKL